jgi:hypothetical protein
LSLTDDPCTVCHSLDGDCQTWCPYYVGLRVDDEDRDPEDSEDE